MRIGSVHARHLQSTACVAPWRCCHRFVGRNALFHCISFIALLQDYFVWLLGKGAGNISWRDRQARKARTGESVTHTLVASTTVYWYASVRCVRAAPRARRVPSVCPHASHALGAYDWIAVCTSTRRTIRCVTQCAYRIPHYSLCAVH